MKTQTFKSDPTTTTNYSNYLDIQTIDFRCFLPFSIVFVWAIENDTKMTYRHNAVVAFSLRTISFSMKTYSYRQDLK